MRKKMCQNDTFYDHYNYKSEGKVSAVTIVNNTHTYTHTHTHTHTHMYIYIPFILTVNSTQVYIP